MIKAESMTSREELHKLVDHIPDADIAAARKILRSLVDPVELSLLTAPLDDEPETEQEREAVEKALSDPRPDVPMDEVLREYGL
ncbi:MAG TPA: hypothetical protein VK776_01695 [Bryobacteraceae bacterium]|nr:hypothetical protein [Bryobacteraceae bacterium]